MNTFYLYLTFSGLYKIKFKNAFSVTTSITNKNILNTVTKKDQRPYTIYIGTLESSSLLYIWLLALPSKAHSMLNIRFDSWSRLCWKQFVIHPFLAFIKISFFGALQATLIRVICMAQPNNRITQINVKEKESLLRAVYEFCHSGIIRTAEKCS